MRKIQAQIEALERKIAKPKITATFVVEIGGDEAAQRFRNFLNVLEQCNTGCSRRLHFDWDGDGADYIHVEKDGGVEPKGTDNATEHDVIVVCSDGIHSGR